MEDLGSSSSVYLIVCCWCQPRERRELTGLPAHPWLFLHSLALHVLLLLSSWSFLLLISIPALLLVLFLNMVRITWWNLGLKWLCSNIYGEGKLPVPLGGFLSFVLFLFKFKCSVCFRRTHVMTRLVISELAGNFWNSRNCSDSVLAALKKMFETDKNNVCCFFPSAFPLCNEVTFDNALCCA